MLARFPVFSCLFLASGCSLTSALAGGVDTVSHGIADGIKTGVAQVTQPQQAAPQQAATQQAPAKAVPASTSGRRTSGLFAVLDFKNRIKGKDAGAVDAVYFANQVRSAVKRVAPQARVMTRENVIVLLQSQGKSLSDCEGECEVDTGRNLGADMVVSGDLIKIGGTWKLDLRLHQTSDGQLISGAAASGKSPDALDQDANRAVAELLSSLP